MSKGMACPCGSLLEYNACCEPFHRGTSIPNTAEQLMRSRYSAFVNHLADYLVETHWQSEKDTLLKTGYQERAVQSLWIGLNIHETTGGGLDDTRGTVTFTARSMMNGQVHEQHEKSLFRKKSGRWYYVKPVA